MRHLKYGCQGHTPKGFCFTVFGIFVIKLPGDSETVIDSDDSDALASYADETKVQSVITNVFTKLGLDESVINSLFMGNLSDNSSYDYDMEDYDMSDYE